MMHMDDVKAYLGSATAKPYFLFVGDQHYQDTLDELRACGLEILPTSDFCSGEDKLPDLDALFNSLEAAGSTTGDAKLVLTGLGEFLGFCEKKQAESVLLRLKDCTTGRAKVVLLLRGVVSLLDELQRRDLRFNALRYAVIGQATCKLSFTLAEPAVGLAELTGFKALLIALEGGQTGNLMVSTAAHFAADSIFTVRQIKQAYEGIQLAIPGFPLASSCGTDAQWSKLLSDLKQHEGSLEQVFAAYGLQDNLEAELSTHLAANDHSAWMYYLCLKYKVQSLGNAYLRYVLERTEQFAVFFENVRDAILEVEHKDKRYPKLYQDRKDLIPCFETGMQDFIIKSRQIVSEEIYKLTDQTLCERQEIIAWLTRNELIAETELTRIYPDLAAYLQKYEFKCSDPALAALLTHYFTAYKRQKLSNQLEEEFLQQVDELACARRFNRLPTRDEILEKIEKEGSYLYWLDALGVEYLSCIAQWAQKHRLSLQVHIARATLPTITSLNKDFFDTWPEGARDKNGDLDEIKHKEKGGYSFLDDELPVHLAKELEIIADMMKQAAGKLKSKACRRFLIVSDHGASRLAVLRRKEEKYETDTVGKHSGRCCPLLLPHDSLPFAAEENGYLVLADYGRFKGSRAANVEVHGGASLEEVVVPVIELTLPDERIIVKLVEETVAVDFRTGATISLFLNTPVQELVVRWDGRSYPVEQTDPHHFRAHLPEMKRAGDYPVDVYAGTQFIGSITIKAQGKSGQINKAFDDLF